MTILRIKDSPLLRRAGYPVMGAADGDIGLADHAPNVNRCDQGATWDE
jgi:hypothetical protein